MKVLNSIVPKNLNMQFLEPKKCFTYGGNHLKEVFNFASFSKFVFCVLYVIEICCHVMDFYECNLIKVVILLFALLYLIIQ